ncbi:MAG: [ribosomal protein S18]-alanine N-acetyltransferase, partial [Actinomycetota bacterium]|nr:[ribosomal protein S18]-alanine N-acetyltransferase [Actinomycetota bacterium]
MAAEREIVDVEVQLVPMRRRHLRSVVRIEAQVYPRPWSHSLFVSELALRSSRSYVVAKVGRDVVGYAGLMMSLTDGHVTTIAVDPAWHRRGIGIRLLLALAQEAVGRGALAM